MHTIQASSTKSKQSTARYILSLVIKILPRATIASAALFLLQCLYVVYRTPRLPPPPLSGIDFPKDGIVVLGDGEAESDAHAASDEDCIGYTAKKGNEFRLALIGDSPVEGIGNNHHSSALCGETANAFAKRVCDQQGRYDCVRYWSFGKSGLTAAGIDSEMVPLLQSTVDFVNETTDTTREPTLHVIVLLCGVNNVLSLSTPSSFATEVASLLTSIRSHRSLEQTPIILLGLPDFSRLPFLPAWPMAWLLGLKGRRLQQKLEDLIKEIRHRTDSINVVLVRIPEVQDVIGSRGYLRLDSSNIGDETATDRTRFMSSFCHPLLKHLGHDAINPSTVSHLGIDDFLCDDGFHPGRYGVSISVECRSNLYFVLMLSIHIISLYYRLNTLGVSLQMLTKS